MEGWDYCLMYSNLLNSLSSLGPLQRARKMEVFAKGCAIRVNTKRERRQGGGKKGRGGSRAFLMKHKMPRRKIMNVPHTGKMMKGDFYYCPKGSSCP